MRLQASTRSSQYRGVFIAPFPVGNTASTTVLRIRDVYSGSRILIFTHPGSRIQKQQQKRGVIWCHTFLCIATNFTKLYIILLLKCWRKKFGPIFKELYNFLTKKLSLSSQKYGFGIRDPEKTYFGSRIPDPGVKKAPDPGSWIPDPDQQHWSTIWVCVNSSLRHCLQLYVVKKTADRPVCAFGN